MSVKTKLARRAVKTTAKHTAHGTLSKIERKPFRSVTLLALGAAVGGLVGWLVGRSGGGDDAYSSSIAQAPPPPNVSTLNNNSTEKSSETGAVS